ncbi:uncharacterized protein GIQ15_02514 [Arthroderma uncinatum]|uniref:uncharacterized protein n=1 Tax=Arthroderma uncinatum TaxID=74035 RepID=UPI00144A9022|nr:uncharacterized protein GIQ15_02514 [Arthroderma uncinatum]KAF3483190.1 hypothetical protein GIQ15_02514 [Arthroderma uncinatum]
MGDGNPDTRLDGAAGPQLEDSFAPANPSQHKSNRTGNTRIPSSLLSRFTFTRMIPSDETKNTHDKAEVEEEENGDEGGGDRLRTVLQPSQRLKVPDRAMASALNQQRRKTRRRKGSLRKTALLGTGMLRMEGKERFTGGGTALQRATEIFLDQYDGAGEREGDNGREGGSGSYGDGGTGQDTVSIGKEGRRELYQLQQGIVSSFDDGESTPRRSYSHSNTLAIDRDDSSWTRSQQQDQQQQQQLRHSMINADSFPNTAPVGPSSAPNSVQDDATTDDEDGLSLPRLNTSNFSRLSSKTSNSSISTSPVVPPRRIPLPSIQTPSSSSDSFFKHTNIMKQRERSASQRIRSPLATSNTAELTSPSEIWDYSETEWWGWIILIVTWLVFVVGMGSCLGVWSWAWDVGETPYAPPELEDDATLPIVGYYPALIVLTAVMAWVWVVVAWVGMKYFRHANISGDDT